jgi:shikimate 5-dehydrogenase
VVVLVAQGGARGRNVDGVGFLWWMKKEEEAEEENLLRGEGGPRSGCPYRR